MRPLTTTCIVALVGVASLSLLAWPRADANTPAPVAAAPTTVVEVAPVVSTGFVSRHWASGDVVSQRDARAASEASGRVLQVAEVGDRVAAGAALAVIDDTALRLREQQVQAELAQVQARLDLATSQQQRYRQLGDRQAIARVQLDQLDADREILAREREATQALLAQVRHQRTQMTVRAPFAGVVVERFVQRGEYLAIGNAVVRVVDTATPQVRVRAPVGLARHLAAGTEVTVRADGQQWQRSVTALVPVGDEHSRQLELRIDLPGSDLPIGTAVEVAMPNADERAVLAVPRDAVNFRREGSHVLRIDAEGLAERIIIRTGSELDGLVEIIGETALTPGDLLVIRGGEYARPGQPVVIAASKRGDDNDAGRSPITS